MKRPFTSFDPKGVQTILAKLRKANAAYAKGYPGEPGDRQPVHTFYGGAHLFRSDTAQKLGASALKTLLEYAPNYAAFGVAIGLGGNEHLERAVYTRVMKKLKYEPVEDFRIDFEDGYGNRLDEEEDLHAAQAAEETARGAQAGTLPPFIGIRIKPLSGELHVRSLRTLDIFVSTLASAKGKFPDFLCVTLPKITRPEQVSALAKLLGLLESKNKLKPGTLKIELMIETSQSVLKPDGGSALLELARAAGGRCIGAHFGTYDYTAGLGITAAHQHMTHPACDFARHVMQVSLAGTGVRLSDGGTNILPVPPYTGNPGGSTEAVHRAWRLHAEHIRHSLVHGFYQGWDLHPAQLPTRYAAVYAFFLEGLKPASARLKAFVEKAAQATLLGDVFDDAATGQGLLNYFLRGLNCGAITEEEAKATGLSLDELRSRSFVKILENRKPR